MAMGGGGGGNPFANVKLKKSAPVKEAKDKFGCPPKSAIDGWLNTAHLVKPDALQTDGWLDGLLVAYPDTKVVLLDFFAYSCTNCVRTIDGIQDLHEKYSKDGLLIVALHRPEFDFEREQKNLQHFLTSARVTYLVGMDNQDKAWEAWDVSMWPTHFLCVPRKDKDNKEGPIKKLAVRGGDPALWVGDSHKNHVEIEEEIKKVLYGNTATPPPTAAAAAHDEAHWQDMEIFFGKLHHYKNVPTGGKSCGEGACVVARPANVQKAALVEGKSTPASKGLTVYGAGWCRFCRAAKLLLSDYGVEFRYVDVEALGGPAAVIAALDISQKTIPIVYSQGGLLGGYDSMCASLAPDDSKGPEAKAAHETRVANATEAGKEAIVRFDKNGHKASVALPHGWGMQEERVIAREEGAMIEAQLTLGNVPPGAPITVYVVGGPDVQASTEDAGGASIELLLEEGAPSGSSRTIATAMAGRHFACSVPNGSTVRLRCALSFCFYVLYVTNEPRSEPGAGRAAAGGGDVPSFIESSFTTKADYTAWVATLS